MKANSTPSEAPRKQGEQINRNITAMFESPRCTAHSKRSGLPCKNGRVRGWTVCRFHGVGSGRPVTTGEWTKESMETKALIAMFSAQAKAMGYRKLKPICSVCALTRCKGKPCRL